MPKLPIGLTYDNALLIHDGVAAITADGGGVVGGSAKILDLGEGVVSGLVKVTVSAIDLVGGDEIYSLLIQGSTVATMATDKVCLASRILGANAVILSDEDEGVGEYLIPFVNIDSQGQVQRYIRIFVDVAGATASITFKAFVSTRH